METVILRGASKAELKMITDLAKRLGIQVKYLTEDEKEEAGLLAAMKTGRTGKTSDAAAFAKKLKK